MRKKMEGSAGLPVRGSDASSETFSSRFGTDQSTVQLSSISNAGEESKINPLRKQISANQRQLVQLLADGDSTNRVQDSLDQVGKSEESADKDYLDSRKDSDLFEDRMKNMPSQQKRGNVFYNLSGDISFQES